MQRTSVWIEKGDVQYIQKLGFTLSGFVRAKILELKEKTLTPDESRPMNLGRNHSSKRKEGGKT